MSSKKAPLTFPLTVEVEMTLTATVTVTQEIADGIADQYPELWRQHRHDPEELAKSVLYASIGRYCRGSNVYEDWWDGVGDLKGLIRDMELS